MISDTGTSPRTSLATRLPELERVLSKHPAVHETVVLRRQDKQEGARTVAYVVPTDIRLMETLPADLRRQSVAPAVPDGYVFLSSIPRDEAGRVATDRLSQFEVIDEDLLNRWKNELVQSEHFHQVEVIATEACPALERIHRWDLLPGGSHRGEKPDVLKPESPKNTGVKKEKENPARPALAHGAPLIIPEDGPETLGEALRRTAVEYPDNGITCLRADGSAHFYAYPRVLADAEEVLAGLSAQGLKSGDKVILQLADSHEFLTAFWACVLGGMVPAPLSIASSYAASNATVQRLSNAWQLLERPLILAGDALIPGLRSALGLAGAAAERVQAIGNLPKGGAVPRHEARPDDVTLILFTSGSTGVPKGVMQSHRSLLCMARGTAQQNRFSSQDVTLNWMPLEHVGAISFLHIIPVLLGCRQVHVPTDYILQDPLRWLDLIEQFGATISWGPNFAFNLINERSQDLRQRRWDLSSMRFLVSAGELIVSNTTRRFLDLLAPHGLASTALRPAFGMSETCSGITWSDGYRKDANAADNPFVDLGPPIPSASLRIVDDADRVVGEGEIGRLQLQGPSVTSGYCRNPEANHKAFTADGWFDTGDLGFLRDGCLTLTGREKDEIIINGINYVAAEIEAVVDAVEGVQTSFSAACAARRGAGNTDELAIFFCPSPEAEQNLAPTLLAVRRQIAQANGISPTYIVPLTKERVPKTAIGKIQRSELRRRFESGEFDAMMKRADLLTETNVLPEWFHEKVWQPKELPAPIDRSELGPSLIFVDGTGLGHALGSRLRESGQPCIEVEAGADFARLDDNRYRLDPKNRDHYRRLLEALQEQRLRIDQIVHLWTCDDAAAVSRLEELVEAQHRGLYSVLFLVQALAAAPDAARGLSLYVVSRGTQVTSSMDECSCRHSAVIGLLKTIPQELKWLRCRHIDLETKPQSPEESADQVLGEMLSPSVDDEVAYRNGRRLAWRLARVDMRSAKPAAPMIRRGGIYLITGGLGGIGAHLAALLRRDYQAKLILVGTTRLPDRAEWEASLKRGGKIAGRLEQYLEIESLGPGEVVYESADVADEARLNDIVAAAETRWGETLAGVFHLAAGGDVASHWQDGERNQLATVSAASFDLLFRSKVYGTWALHRVAQKRPEAIMVSFGSVLGIFGAARLGAYVAAHTFMRNFTLNQRHHHHARSYIFSWTVWQETGLSKSEPAFAKDLYRALGYFLISKEQGLDSLIGGLSRDLPDLIVGLDAGNLNIRRHLTGTQALQKIVAYFTARKDGKGGESESSLLTVPDCSGVSGQYQLVQLGAMPLTSAGAIDREALRVLNDQTGSSRGHDAASGNETEKQVAAIWRDVLGRQPGMNDSFFQLGGNSLSATQAISRINQLFQMKLEVRDMFEHGTVRELAGLVAQRQQQQRMTPDPDMVGILDIQALMNNVDQMSDEQVAELLGRMQQGQESRP